MSQQSAFSANILIKAMSPDDVDLLRPVMIRIALEHRQVFVEAGKPIAHVFFPESGIASIVSSLPEQGPTEVGIFGREGFPDPRFCLEPTALRTIPSCRSTATPRCGLGPITCALPSRAVRH